MSQDTWAKALMQKLGIGDALRPRWSYSPRRETALYYELFHTSPRLDALYMVASDVASATFKLYDKKQKKFDEENADPIQEHILYDVLENPMPDHSEMDGFTLMFLTIVYRELIGEAFWLIERSNKGVPAEIYPVPPNWVLTTPTAPTPYFMIVPMGNTSHKPLAVPETDVIWFKEPNIISPYGRGRARTEAVGDELEADELAAKYGKNYFFNDATPPIVIEAPGATPEMAERFKESWFQKVGGFLNARKPGIIPWKDSKITKLADSAREMDFVETRKFLRDVCNQHWSQPPELSGILENSNRSTIDSAYYLWTKNVISKKLSRMEATLNRQLVPMFDDTVVLKYDNVVPQDDAFDLQVATSGLAAGAITVNEWRQKNGMKPQEGADVYLRTFSVSAVPIGNIPPPPEPEPEPEPIALEKKTVTIKYDEDQERDEGGRWADGGGSASSEGGRALVSSSTGSELPPHIQSLKIPPAWTDVKYSEDPDADLLAVGKDAKGRSQYVYSESFVAAQSAAKFERISALDDKIDGIREQVSKDLKGGSEEAACLSTIMATGIRPGSDKDTGAEKQAYGATTLKAEHVKVDSDGNVSLQFVGKKGVDLNIPVEDAKVSAMLIERVEGKDPGAAIFNTDAGKLSEYTHSLGDGGFKTKDMRTYLGTKTARDIVKSMPTPKNPKEYKSSVMKVAKIVSTKLGNTPTVALQSYIAPASFADWKVASGI